MKKRILVLLGPNLDTIGTREQRIYGEESAESINHHIKAYAEKHSFTCEIFQSNHEGDLIDKIHTAQTLFDYIILNAGALAHYSFALRDAIAAIKKPCIEVHMSNIYARETFRRKSVIAEVCVGTIVGFGAKSYLLAIKALEA